MITSHRRRVSGRINRLRERGRSRIGGQPEHVLSQPSSHFKRHNFLFFSTLLPGNDVWTVTGYMSPRIDKAGQALTACTLPLAMVVISSGT